jgi:NTP pyrophosphatase (non-canonical NTP hydrolase)
MSVLTEVRQERKHQDKKWGQQNHQSPIWLAILSEEVGEASEEVLNELFPAALIPSAVGRAALRRELIQVAAVAVAWIECLDRNDAPPPAQP